MNAQPAEPIRLSDLLPGLPAATVELRAEGLAFFGGGSPYRQDEPYLIEQARVGGPGDALRWMAHLTTKRWATGEKFWYSVASGLEVMVARCYRPLS